MGSKNKKKRNRERLDGIDSNDVRALKNSKYSTKQEEYDTVYVLRHKKFDNKVVELRARSASHACSMVGWRVRHVAVVESYPVEG